MAPKKETMKDDDKKGKINKKLFGAEEKRAHGEKKKYKRERRAND